VITRIEAENLFSWAELDYPVVAGISQISGFNYDDGNYEGSGKSSVLNVASATCFGKIPKDDVLLDDLVREGQKNAWGRVTVSSGHKVLRRWGKGHGLFIVDPAGNERKATQAEVDDMLGMSMHVFFQSVYFAQNYPKRFITADEETKAKILTEIRDIRVYDLARKVADDRLKAAKDELDAARVFLKDYAEQLDAARRDAEWAQAQVDEFAARKAETIARINSQIDELRAGGTEAETEALEDMARDLAQAAEAAAQRVTELTAAEREARLLAESNRRAQVDIGRLESEVGDLERSLEEVQEADKCPTCGHEVTKDDLETHIEETKARLAEARSRLEEKRGQLAKPTADALFAPAQLSQASADEVQLRARLKRAEAELREAQLHNAAAAQVASQVAGLREQRKAEKARTPDDLLAKLAEFQDKVARLEDRHGDKQAEVDRLAETARKLEELRKGFRQIKSDIFETALTELGRTANGYLQELFETPVKIRFENVQERGVTKIKTFVSIQGKERSLGLYSGGQFRRISIAVDLALAKMVASRSTKPFNMRVLDEPCKDLSPQSKEKLMGLLRKLPGVTILIEHDKEIQSSVDSNFRIELRGGISRKVK
jgi:DNA repair exonuclease SbcCD ATPase subunit